MWKIPDGIDIHIKKWDNDAIIFIDGPDDTHLIDLHTASLLEFLKLRPTVTDNELSQWINMLDDSAFQFDDAYAILNSLKILKLVEESSETGQSKQLHSD